MAVAVSSRDLMALHFFTQPRGGRAARETIELLLASIGGNEGRKEAA